MLTTSKVAARNILNYLDPNTTFSISNMKYRGEYLFTAYSKILRYLSLFPNNSVAAKIASS